MKDEQKFTPEQTELELPYEKQEAPAVETETEATSAESKGEQLSMESMPPFKKVYGKKRSKKIFLYLAFALLCAGSIAFTAYMDFNTNDKTLPFTEIMAILGQNWYYLLLALLSVFLVLLCDGLKTSLLLYGSIKKFRFGLSLKTATLTKFYDYVTPFGAGGQPFAIYHMNKKGVEGGAATAVVLAAFFLQQICFVVLSIVGLSLSGYTTVSLTQKIMSIFGAIACLLVPALIIVFSLLPKTTAKLLTGTIRFLAKIKLIKNPDAIIEKTVGGVAKNTECIKSISKNKTVFILSILLSIGGWCAMCSIAYFTLRSFGYDLKNVNGFIEWLQIAQMSLICYMSVAFIPTPGNAGASEVSFYFIFTTSLAGGVGFTALIFWRFLSYYSYIIIGGITIFADKLKDKKRLKLKEK